jgi:hypothetical protein
MYSKFFLVFFSLLLLMLSGLAESFQKKTTETPVITARRTCKDRLLPAAARTGSFSNLVHEVSCEK